MVTETADDCHPRDRCANRRRRGNDDSELGAKDAERSRSGEGTYSPPLIREGTSSLLQTSRTDSELLSRRRKRGRTACVIVKFLAECELWSKLEPGQDEMAVEEVQDQVAQLLLVQRRLLWGN